MAVLYTNNAASTLSASITNSQTSLSVASGQGALFPSVSGGDYFYATLVDGSANIEIVKVTARSVDTFTVVRGQDGTTGRAYSAGDKVELRIVRALLDDIKTDISATAASTYMPKSGGNFTSSVGITAGIPRFNLTESDGTSTHAQTTMIRDADVWAVQTRDSSGTFVSNDYRMTVGASGASVHEWRVANSVKLTLDSALTMAGTVQSIVAGTAIIAAASGDTTNYTALRLRQTATESRLENLISGTGAYTPLAVYVGGVKAYVFGTAGQFGVGATPSYGTTGQVFTSNGPNAAPSWQTSSGGGSGITTGKAIAMAMIFGG